MTHILHGREVALALSGGGVRAMVFHLGVLRYLAENNALERVARISTVSGGSLLVGLIYQRSAYRWPSSSQFLTSIYPELRRDLTTKSLYSGIFRQLLRPENWRYALQRTMLLAAALRREWGITANLASISAVPEWSINGTTAETGRRFRFKHDSIGDYALGYAPASEYPLSNALAVSAAYPGILGPLFVETQKLPWKKRSDWNAPAGSEQLIRLPFDRLHLYDGGVYDNLGLESFFNAGNGKPKQETDFIFVSDAGAPLGTGTARSAINPARLLRIAEIMSEQSRALRVRTFVHYLQQHPADGCYAYIGTPVTEKYCRKGMPPANYPTDLKRIAPDNFDCIAGHGHGVAEEAYRYCLQPAGTDASSLRSCSACS